MPFKVLLLLLSVIIITSCMPTRMDLYVDHYLKAIQLYEDEKHELALHSVSRAINLNTTIAEGYHLRGKIQLHLADYRRSVTDLTTALNIGISLPESRGDAFFWRGLAKIKMNTERTIESGCRDFGYASDYGITEVYEFIESFCPNQ